MTRSQRSCRLRTPGHICTRADGHGGPCATVPVRPSDVTEGFDASVSQQALQHSLPWHVESDWTEEVIASDGYCIAKCRERTHAEAIINAAKRLMRRA